MPVLEQTEWTCWTDDYWLRHCEGFRVDTDEGRLGYVEEVLVDQQGRPFALRISGRDELVPVAKIEALSAGRQLITLS